MLSTPGIEGDYIKDLRIGRSKTRQRVKGKREGSDVFLDSYLDTECDDNRSMQI